jgi:hypothetical protein
MSSDPAFEQLWHRHDDFEFSEPGPDYCPYAEQFHGWAEALWRTATQRATVVSINQAKVLLLDKYFEWRAAVPKAHRNHLSSSTGHTCIFYVFEEAYERLKVVELSLAPPMLFLPEPPPPPPQIAGIFIGNVEDG